MEFKDKLKKIRTEKGISQQALTQYFEVDNYFFITEEPVSEFFIGEVKFTVGEVSNTGEEK